MTTIEPLAPLVGEPLLPATTPPVSRARTAGAAMPMVRVNLLPAEVTAARRGHRTRRTVLVALVVLALALAAVSFLVRSGIGDAQGDLTVAEAVNANLQAQQGRYGDVVTAQGALTAAQRRLADLTAGDVGWADVTRAVRAAAPSGVTVTGIDGSGATDSGTAGSVGGAPGGAGAAATPAAAGTLVVVGSAPDPGAVATYVDALAGQPALADVAATGVVALASGGYTFGITAVVTPAALSHRFEPAGGR